MILLSRVRSTVRSLLRRDQFEADLDAELEAYIEISSREKIRDGVPPGEARRLARLELGGVEQTKEHVRQERHGGFIDVLWQDVRIAARLMKKDAAAVAITVAALAVGIGGITAIFSVVNGVLLRPLPWGEPDRIVSISSWYTPFPDGRKIVPPPGGSDWPDRNDVLEDVALSSPEGFTLLEGGQASVVNAMKVTPNYLSVVKTKPLHGRDFVRDEARSLQPGPVILSYDYWVKQFGGSLDIVGKALKFAEGPLTVIGVMPRGFRSPTSLPTDLWTAVQKDPAYLTFPGTGRLKAGLTAAQAETRINTLVAEIEKEYPSAAVSRHIQLRALAPVRKDSRRLLWLLFCSVGCILVIAIINVANLLLSRGISRRQEVAMRAALGAGRARLVRHFLTESILLASAGGLLGLLMAYALMTIIISQVPPDFPRIGDVYIDTSVLLFALLTTLLTSVLFGILPALRASKADLQSALKQGTRQSTESRRMRWFRQLLVSIEIALAAMLTTGAAVAGMGFWKAVSVPLGVETDGVVVAQVQFPPPRYQAAVERAAFRDALIDRLRAYSEVESVSLADMLPINIQGMRYASASFEGINADPQAPPEDRTAPTEMGVTSDYFRTLRIPFVSGRTFGDERHEVVINETLARRHWRSADPLGTRVRFSEDGAAPWFTIVGVVKDQNAPYFLGFGDRRMAEVFRPCDFCYTVIVKARNRSAGIDESIRKEVAAMDPTMPITRLETLDRALMKHTNWANPRFRSTLFGAFGGAALFLALAGAYGVAAYSAAQRTREVGVRIAVGATRPDIVRLMMAEAAVPAVAGIVAGLLAAFNLREFLNQYAFEVSPAGPGLFTLVGGALLIVTLLANFFPIRRAASADPLTSLRCE